METDQHVKIDWDRLKSERVVRFPGEVVDYRALVIGGLSRTIREETSLLVMRMRNSMIRAGVKLPTEDSEITDEDGPIIKVMVDLFDEHREQNDGVLIKMLPEIQPNTVILEKYTPEEDIVNNVALANTIIIGLNALSGLSYRKFYIEVQQIYRLFDSLTRNGANYSAESPEEF